MSNNPPNNPTNFTLSNDQFTQLLSQISNNNNNVNKSKVEKLQQLNELSRSAIEDFIYDYNRKKQPNDNMIHFVGRDVHEYLQDQATKNNLSINDDAHVTKILQDLLNDLDLGMQFGSERDYARELSWPVAGTVEEKLTKFMQLARRIEKRIPDIDNVFVRQEFNKALCKVLPTSFGLTENMIHHDKFKSLSGINEFLKSRTWAVSNNERPNRVPVNAVVQQEDTGQPMVEQALAVLKEQNLIQLNHLKAELKELKEQQKNQNNNNPNNQILPFMFEMMKIQAQNNNNSNQFQQRNYIPQQHQQFANSPYVPQHQQMMNAPMPQPQFNAQPQVVIPRLTNTTNTPSNQQSNNKSRSRRKPDHIIKLLDQYGLSREATLYVLCKTGHAISCTFTVKDKYGNVANIAGHLDSGAYTTAGSYRLHSPYCKNIRDVQGEVYLVLPNKTCIQSHKMGTMDIVATNDQQQTMQFKNVMVNLVEDDNWSDLLIGRPTLRYHNLLPEQNFNTSNRSNNFNVNSALLMNTTSNDNATNSGNNVNNNGNQNNPLQTYFTPAQTNLRNI